MSVSKHQVLLYAGAMAALWAIPGPGRSGAGGLLIAPGVAIPCL